MKRGTRLTAVLLCATLAVATLSFDALAAPGAPGAAGTFTRGADAPPTSAGATSAPSMPPPRDATPIVPGDPAGKADQDAPAAPETPRRDVPVYNNRGSSTTAGDVALGALRVVVSPISRFWAVDPAGLAANVNALDEVPDSSWFQNRLGTSR